jgi:hypothetical protein
MSQGSDSGRRLGQAVEEGQDLGVSTVTLGEPDEAGMIEPPHQLQADDLLGEPPHGAEAPDPQSDLPKGFDPPLRLARDPSPHGFEVNQRSRSIEPIGAFGPLVRGSSHHRRVDRSEDRPNSGVDSDS